MFTHFLLFVSFVFGWVESSFTMLYRRTMQKELADIARDKDLFGVSIEFTTDDLTYMCGTIGGPVDTPYKGGVFVVDVQLPFDYPFTPPKIHFVTRSGIRM